MKLDSNFKDSDIFFITSLNICITCNKSKLNYFFKKLNEFPQTKRINFVVEAKNNKDSYYLKKIFKDVNFVEDNTLFLTQKLNTPFLLINNINKNKMIFKINNIENTFKDNFFKYLFCDTIRTITDYTIEEANNHYLSRIEINNLEKDLRIFDYDNKYFNIYKADGSVSQSISFNYPYMFYTGEKKYISILEKQGINFDNSIVKVNFNADTIYVLFDRCLYNIRANKDSTYAIDLRTFLCTYYKDTMISKKILDFGNYIDYFYVNGCNYFRLIFHPKLFRDTTVFLKSELLNNKMDCIAPNYSLQQLNKETNLKISSLRDFTIFDINQYGYIFFILKDSNIVYLLKDAHLNRIDLEGILRYNDDIIFHDWRLSNNELFVIFSDKINLYIQKYSLITGQLIDEIISAQGNDKIIKSLFFSILSNNILLINRWQNKRWEKQKILY